jgi:hypothetical protein
MSLAGGDLTTLGAAKLYINSPPADPVLAGLITRISAMIRNSLNRRLLVPRTYVHQFDGTGTRQLVLPEWPVVSLASLVVDGVVIQQALPASNSTTAIIPYGWRYQPWDGQPPGEPAAIELSGATFIWGKQNVIATYTAGYQVTGEAATLDASGSYTPQTPFGTWATDQGVTYAATKAPLVAVSTAPSLGQYIPPAPDAPSPTTKYTFNTGESSNAVLFNYGYVPADIEQVALELIAERASYRSRVGEHSHNVGGQMTVTFDLSGIPKYAVDILLPYLNVLPPPMGASV